MQTQDLLLLLIGFFFPVFLKRGLFSADFLINILLCLLGFIPGLFHCFYIISKYPHKATYASLTDARREGNYGTITAEV